jgi:hypothetical protein
MNLNRSRRLPPALFLFVLVGCGQNGPELHPVSGKVTADGRSLENATVVFHPVGGSADAPKPRGKVGADGSFALTTHTAGDGAPPGEYRVTVELWLAGARPDEPPVNRLPEKYAKPESSGLTATVTTGPNELKPLTVTVKR